MGLLNVLKRVFTWWDGQTFGTQLWTWRKGTKVGEDALGNVYYTNADKSRRWVIYKALREGGYYPWDYQPLQTASERYMRNHMDLNALEAKKRVPKRT